MNWYEMTGALDGFENNPDYLEKANEYDVKVTTDIRNRKKGKNGAVHGRAIGFIRKKWFVVFFL